MMRCTNPRVSRANFSHKLCEFFRTDICFKTEETVRILSRISLERSATSGSVAPALRCVPIKRGRASLPGSRGEQNLNSINNYDHSTGNRHRSSCTLDKAHCSFELSSIQDVNRTQGISPHLPLFHAAWT